MSKLTNKFADLLESKEKKVATPRKFAVIIHNDDFTTMDFVVEVLECFFKHSYEKAVQIMLDVHNTGKGICGIYPFGIAETKVMEVNAYSKANQYPLLCTMEQV